MIHLLIDIGNSTIVVAVADNDGGIHETWRFKTQKDATSTYFRHELMSGLAKLHISRPDIASVTVSSVVPEVNDDIAQAVVDATGQTPYFFSSDDVLRIMSIDIDSPSLAGNDRLADALGAMSEYGCPVIVFDMGTATTVGMVNEERTFIGGMIIPGVKTSLTALSARASQLPTINISKPRHIVGRNTLECMQSGIVYGTASMIDGIIDRLLPLFPSKPAIVATGGMARKIVPHCYHDIIIDEWLQFKGIFHARR